MAAAGDGEVAVINVDMGNGFAFLDGEEDDEVIMAAARARFEEEKARVKVEKAAERARVAAEKAAKKAIEEEEKAEAERWRRWRARRNNRFQPYNGEIGDPTQQYQNREGYYRGSNGNRPVSSESENHGADNVNQYNGDGGNNQRYHDRVYNGYRNNGSSSHVSQESKGGINHNRRDGIQQWRPKGPQPQDLVSEETQQVVDVEKQSDSVQNEAVKDPEKPKTGGSNGKKGDQEEKKAVVVVEEDYSKLKTLKEYEKSLLEKRKEIVSLKGGEGCRKVTIDKELESMKLLGKKSESTDQKLSQNKEEKKTGPKVKASQNVVAQKIGLKFQYKPPVEFRRWIYNNDRGGQNLEGGRPNAGRDGDCNARPNGAVDGSIGNKSEVLPNAGDHRQYANAGRGGAAGYDRPNAGRRQGAAGYDRPNGVGGGDRRQYVNARPNGANAGETRQGTEGNVAPAREANGERANVARRGPSLPLPRVEDPAQFPALG